MKWRDELSCETLLICLFLIQTLDLIFLGMILFVVLLYPFCVAVKLMSIFGKVFE